MNAFKDFHRVHLQIFYYTLSVLECRDIDNCFNEADDYLNPGNSGW